MKLLNEPKNRINAVAASALTVGKAAYINTDGKLAHPTDATTAAEAVYFIQRPREYCVNFDGYSATITAGELVEGINGFKAIFDTAELNIADDFTAVNKGTKLGITNSGLIAKATSAAANTTGLLRLISFTGNTTSGQLEAIVDFRI